MDLAAPRTHAVFLFWLQVSAPAFLDLHVGDGARVGAAAHASTYGWAPGLTAV